MITRLPTFCSAPGAMEAPLPSAVVVLAPGQWAA